MIDLKLTEKHDLSLSPDLSLVDGVERVAQQVKITLWTLYQEWFLDSRVGIPYHELVLVKNPNMQIIYSLFRRAIMSVEGTKSVRELTLTVDAPTRTLHIGGLVMSKYGPVRLNERYNMESV